MEVDPRFAKSGQRARQRRNKRYALRAALGTLAACLIAVPFFMFTDMAPRVAAWWGSGADDGETLVQVETTVDVAPIVSADVFIDIPGDPKILRLDDRDTGNTKVLSGPPVLDIARVGLPNADRLSLVREDLVVAQRQLMTALPSSPEDFAAFQTQRARAFDAPVLTAIDPLAQDPTLASLDTDVELGDLTDSYGTSLEAGQSEVPKQQAPGQVENTTSVSFLRPEADRLPLFQEIILTLEIDRDIADVLTENGVPAAEATRTAQEIAAIIPRSVTLQTGAVIAMRLSGVEGRQRLTQVSLYAPDGYLGTVARAPDGALRAGTDPWIADDLLALAGRDAVAQSQSETGTYRLIDALYSAAIRNGLPTSLAGELVALVSETHDLERDAKPDDRVTLLFAPRAGPAGQTIGQVLFVALRSGGSDLPCYVVTDREKGGYTCFVPGLTQPGTGASGSGFVTPVAGVMTSRFGPRKHPIHRVVRLHAGVDWAAPTGTPVYAATAGKVALAGDGRGYGNLVILTHAGGLETRYAHLNKFAPGLTKGATVARGQVIGYVGTTGASTGPHLHFETRQNGKPIDPIGVLRTRRPASATGAGSNAVEALIAQIIRVESAGDPNAKNPLSSATGLGQFISSTWLRMMKNYRPDLVASMSRQDLLNLRRDPTLSREMVKRLAQENESYLRARGHSITAGRLYLAHFLGPEGANKVLRADPNATILNVMGASVVKANPFLRRYSVADLRGWADRKMRGRGGTPGVAAPAPVAVPVVVSPEIKLYQQMIDAMITETG